MTFATEKDAQEWLREHEEERSPARATVYSNGTDATIFYSWQPQQAPPKDWQHAGTLFVVPQENGWQAKARTADAKWCAVMEQALPHFETKVKELLKLLNEAGHSLTDLNAFVALSKQPELMRELEEQLKQ